MVFGIRALGCRDYWDCFFENNFVNWAFFEVSCVFLSAKSKFDGTVAVFGALIRAVVITTIYVFRFVVAIVDWHL